MAKKVFTSDSWDTFAAGITSLKSKSDNTNIAYGTCTTAAGTAAKVINITGNTQWELVAGSVIVVFFNATNTASNPTFNVGGTGAKNVYYGASQITTSSLSYAGYANRVVTYIYDGAQYRFMSWGYDGNTNTQIRVYRQTTGYNADYPLLAARTKAADIAKKDENGTYEGVYGVMWNDTTKVPTLNPSTGAIKAVSFTGDFKGDLTGDVTGNASSATKVNKNLVVQLNAITDPENPENNTGVTEGTDLFTFNGSEAKTINITPSSIGAASSIEVDTKFNEVDEAIGKKANTSHTHTIANVTNLQTTLDGKAASSHKHKIADISDLTATATELNYVGGVTSNIQTQLNNKAASSHTHNYAGSSSAGGAATSANKVNKNLIVKLNSGTTEGTNLFTFNGSADKTVNITPASIGAATSGHNHDSVYYTEIEIDTKLNDINTAINKKANSTHTHAISDVTNLQTTLDGKAASSHKHAISDVTNLQTTLDSKVPTSRTINSKPLSENITLSASDVGAAASSHGHAISGITNLQTTLDGKQPTVTGAATTITSSNLTANRALVSNGSGKIAVSGVTSTELGYLDGVTSNVQTQLDGKSNTGHTHSYAGSSTVGGAATSANKVNSNLVVKLNSGTTEGTNMFTFNGSGAKTVNITPSAIGAASVTIRRW